MLDLITASAFWEVVTSNGVKDKGQRHGIRLNTMWNLGDGRSGNHQSSATPSSISGKRHEGAGKSLSFTPKPLVIKVEIG